MLNTFSQSLIIWQPAIETLVQEMNGGPVNELGELNSSPHWKSYFNPCPFPTYVMSITIPTGFPWENKKREFPFSLFIPDADLH